MAKLTVREIRDLAEQLILQSPGGIRFSDITRTIALRHPETPRNTINSCVASLASNLPPSVTKPGRGLYAPANGVAPTAATAERNSRKATTTRPPALKSLELRNILSFGDEPTRIDLRPLNVLIGPNGSGKSNLIEVIGLLKGATRDLDATIREGGGAREWVWKGPSDGPPRATVEVETDPFPNSGNPLRYRLGFTTAGQGLKVVRESIDNAARPENYSVATGGKARVRARGDQALVDITDDYDFQQSVLTQLKDPSRYLEIAFIAKLFGAIRLYRDLHLGRRAPARMAQPSDLPGFYLDEDLSNLALVVNKIRQNARARRAFDEQLQRFYADAEGIDANIEPGTVHLLLREKTFETPIPTTRLSDGTLRWIALLAILLHPSPPPLVCIEEPEVGLHPDMMPTLAKLLQEASDRMQLIVTTHSDVLVDAMTDTPEAVVVCEKDRGATTLQRLDAEQLAVWLKDYRLGELWSRGEIGGNRW